MKKKFYQAGLLCLTGMFVLGTSEIAQATENTTSSSDFIQATESTTDTIGETSDSTQSTESNASADEVTTFSVEAEETTSSTEEIATQAVGTPQLVYQVHGQNYGWQAPVTDGELGGTAEQSLRMEGIKIGFENSPYQGTTVEYRTYVTGVGWTNWVGDMELSGTENQGVQMEAVQIRLVGEMAANYDIYYRVHAANFGRLDWTLGTEAGASAGTTGFGLRLEGIQIKLVPKGVAFTESTERPYLEYVDSNIAYQAHGESYGWQNFVGNNAIAGTHDQGKRMEGIIMDVSNPYLRGSIQYAAHVGGIGWQNYVNAGQVAGTANQGIRMEGIKIHLTGELANYFDVYYRAHIEEKGWLGWTKNDGIAGSVGAGKRMEGIQVMIVKKDTANIELGQSYCTIGDFVNYSELNRDNLLNIARSYVSGYRYNHDSNIFTSKYNQAHNGWCTLFVQYAFDQAGLRNLVYGGQYEWDPLVVYNYHQQRGQIVTNPQPGDVAFVDWAGRGYITHAEIVESVGNNSINMITGNWNGMVTRVSRTPGQVVGYLRPSY